MVLLTGFFRDSGGNPIASGILSIRLDAPLFDFAATPDALYLQQAAEFAITNGAIGTINLVESATQQVSYEFTLLINVQSVEFYFANGDRYDGPTLLHTDGKYYTGLAYRVGVSVELDRFVRVTPRQIDQFHAIVPDSASVEYSALVPTRVSTDKLPTTIRQLAELLINTQQYRQALRGGPNSAGTFNPTVFYALDDWVAYDGSSYVYVNPLTTRGNYPHNATYWQLVASKGANGTGTNGNGTPYNATTWDGQTDAPSRNAVRGIIEQLARSTQLTALAPIVSPTFTGSPNRSSNPLTGDRSTQIPTTQWMGNEFAPINNANLTGNPIVPTQALTNNSARIANTQWVRSFVSSPAFTAEKTTNQTLTNSSNVLVFTAKALDTDNAFNIATGTFTAPIDGWYEFYATAYIDRTGGTQFDVVGLVLLIGGLMDYRLGTLSSLVASGATLSGAVRLYLNALQTAALRLLVSQGTGTITNRNAIANTILTTFSGRRLPY